MKRYGNLWKDMLSFEALLQAAQQARRGKRCRPAVAAFEFHLERELWRLHAELTAKTYRPSAGVGAIHPTSVGFRRNLERRGD